ncbi:Rho GTPase activation protein, partial [Dimargaris cristalligena]
SPTIYRHTVPDELKSDTSRFRIDSFARTYFATHKRGLFRRKVPLKDMLRFSPNSLHKPLIRLAKDYRRDALKCFKVIQRVMGDRNRSATAADDTDIQWLLDRAIGTAPLRDEIYVQLCKQLTGNPRPESIFRGWLLACVVVQFFPPTTHFEDYLKSFIQLHFDSELQRIDVLSRFTFMKLQKSIRQGPMSKTPSIREISHAKQAPFCPSIFGESLDFIMQNAEAVDTELGIPRILTFLTDIILQLNGPKSEGIFRIPGDVDQVNRLRHRLDTGDYTPPAEISDPNIPASLFKLWLRDLHDPLIPGQFYHHCVNSPQDPDEILKIMTNIKGIRLRVADYVIQFLQVFAQPENSRLSKMNISNLAVVFAPIFLRCPSNNLKQAVVNSQSEQLFVKNLL